MCISSSANVLRFLKPDNLEQLPKQTVWSIAKDHHDFIWFANDAGLFKYDGYSVQSVDHLVGQNNIKSVRAITTDEFGRLWIGTRGNGLFLIENNKSQQLIENLNDPNMSSIIALNHSDEGLWFGTKNQLNIVDNSLSITSYTLPTIQAIESNNMVTAIVSINPNELILSTYSAVFSFDKITHSFQQFDIQSNQTIEIYSLVEDQDKQIWLATNQGLFLKKHDQNKFFAYKPELLNFKINTLVIDDNNLWLGSILKGLVKVSKNTEHAKSPTITYYKNDISDPSSIPGNSVTSLLLDDTGVMFISNFFGGISIADLNTMKFGHLLAKSNSVFCAQSSIFYGIDTDANDTLWIPAQSGLIEFHPANQTCINHNRDINNQILFTKTNPKYTFLDSSNTRWLTTSNGLYSLKQNDEKLERYPLDKLDKFIFFMAETSPGSYILGTTEGLFRMAGNAVSAVNGDQGLANTSVFRFAKDSDKQIYLATDKGLATLKSNDYTIHTKVQQQLPTTNILSLYVNKNKELWVGTALYGLYHFDPDGLLLNSYTKNSGIPNHINILNILGDNDSLWMSTNNGLLQLDVQSGEIHQFHNSDGLQDELFTMGSSHQDATGKLYFGGRNGMNAFYSNDIHINNSPPEVVLTQFTRFGKTVQPFIKDKEFTLSQPINDLDSLNLTHKDYVIGFEFAALDYSDPSRNQYAYKMEGLDPDWNYVNADNRTVSYTNLKAGDYVFKVRGSNHHGVWNELGKQLKIKVYPAPWLSWWAYTIYVLTFFFLLFGYLYRKNKANSKITLMLRDEVQRQTQELQSQKLKVESLLDKKNELFANVSHEFRTPLTLILGPINKLLKSPLGSEDVNAVRMVNRNANRLLTMIEQILQLTKLTDEQTISFIPQQLHSQVDVIVDSFKVLAETKDITLKLNHNDNAAINATQDCIENILGNLLSNAIKYTPNGGEVTVNSQTFDGGVTVSVTDTGCGLNAQQQKDIFNRFERLDIHHDIAGIGIGLSLVKEVVKANKGQISVDSQPGKGSTFAIKFDCIVLNAAIIKNNNSLLIDQMIKDIELDEQNQSDSKIFIGNKNNPNLLIIDDNQDMREHIASSLKDHYYCMLAPRGKVGISLAIKHVPEIIICDVMMPEMDGFQVSRIVRSDSRTSHIPLILLTALNDKQSRIKGWRENIDVYLTKPFDAQELLLQLENILVIRNILKKQANAAIQTGKVSKNSGLAKLDQKFLDKFIAIIEDMYSEPNFLRPQMASMMSVSERQLQRKIKALIDRNPLDLLREYRLKKAAEILKEGQPVSVTAEFFGFFYVRYFSICFKQQYGSTPKDYQTTCKAPKD